MSAPSTSRLDGKVALVTGSGTRSLNPTLNILIMMFAGRGIGREIALELARRGAAVVITYVKDAQSAKSTIEELDRIGAKNALLQGDVSKIEDIVQMFDEATKHFGHLDIVVSNSGTETFGHISEITPDEFDRVFGVNTRGQLFVAQQAYKHLSVGGRLVLMSSISANAKGVPKHSIYAGSKAAVEAFARCLANDFGPKKVTVNAIAPGGVKSDMYQQNARRYIPNSDSMGDEKVDEIMASMSPLGRVGMPNDVARVVAFLCSEDGGWMNGQTLTIGGGAAV
ncbi:MAG: hypothetical protein LQ338_006090 [Usnochroma carphineum]|nr:MAG: hypothetical protein LQ338_006090 [Usnochroma carphineum]